MRTMWLRRAGICLMLMGMAGGFSQAEAAEITTRSGAVPKVQWAVVQSAPGTMEQMAQIGAATVAPVSAQEVGTYALYGAVDAANNNILRLLEIYEDEAAYEVHRSSEGFKEYQRQRQPILAGLRILPVDPIVLAQKGAGEGTVVYLRLVDVQPDKIAAYKALVRQEMLRAVEQESGVMGLFATVERERSNMVHTFELFADEQAYENYKNSAAYKSFQEQAASMINKEMLFPNEPTRIVLTAKGGRK